VHAPYSVRESLQQEPEPEDLAMPRYQLIAVLGTDLVRCSIGDTIAYLESIAETLKLTYYVIEPM
jgi:hypothetical protein